MAKAKKAAADAEVRYQRVRRENLTSEGRLPSKSLEAYILEADSFAALRRDLVLRPSFVLMEQLDSALRDVVYVSDCFSNLI